MQHFLLNNTRNILVLLVFFSLLHFNSKGVTPVSVTFQNRFEKSQLVPGDRPFKTSNNGIIHVKSLKYYISGIRLFNNTNEVYSERNSYHLIDAENLNSQLVLLDVPKGLKYTEIVFDLGIDSVTSVSGAYGDDLDPVNGMYWTWNSGYINFKMEGDYSTSDDVFISYQYHLGGYQTPFNAIQTIKLKLIDNENINIALDLKKLFDTIDFTTNIKIMSPSNKAVEMCNHISKCFYIISE